MIIVEGQEMVSWLEEQGVDEAKVDDYRERIGRVLEGSEPTPEDLADPD